MKLSLAEWDKEIAPQLSGIRIDAGWIAYYARRIKERCAALAAKPGWETEAASELDDAIVELQSAIDVMKQARDELKGKRTCQ